MTSRLSRIGVESSLSTQAPHGDHHDIEPTCALEGRSDRASWESNSFASTTTRLVEVTPAPSEEPLRHRQALAIPAEKTGRDRTIGGEPAHDGQADVGTAAHQQDPPERTGTGPTVASAAGRALVTWPVHKSGADAEVRRPHVLGISLTGSRATPRGAGTWRRAHPGAPAHPWPGRRGRRPRRPIRRWCPASPRGREHPPACRARASSPPTGTTTAHRGRTEVLQHREVAGDRGAAQPADDTVEDVLPALGDDELVLHEARGTVQPRPGL